MNLGLHFRGILEAISPFLQQELEQLVAGIQSGWSRQHEADGSHGDVTARTLRTPRFGVSDVYVKDLPYDQRTGNQGNNNPYFEGVTVPDGFGIILFKAGTFPVLVPGITRFQVVDIRPETPPQTGDMIWVGRHRDSTRGIDLLCSGSMIDRDFGFQMSTTAAANINNTFTLSDSAQGAVLLTPLLYVGPEVNGLQYGLGGLGPWGSWTVPQLTSP